LEFNQKDSLQWTKENEATAKITRNVSGNSDLEKSGIGN
jgi:hypothetical protein